MTTDAPSTSTFRQEFLRCTPGLVPVFVDIVGMAVILPLVAVYVDELGERTEWVGAILTCNFLGQMIGTPVVGFLADRYGPKRAVIGAMVGNCIFFTISAFVSNMPALCVVRLFGAMSNAIGGGQKWIIDSTTAEHREKVLSMLILALLLGFLVGAGVGGATGSWLVSCLVTAGMSLAAGLIVVPFKESVSDADRAEARHRAAEVKAAGGASVSMRDGLRSLGFWLSTSIAAGSGLLFGSSSTLSAVVLVDRYGQDAWVTSVMYYIGIGFVFATQLTVAPLLTKYGDAEFVMTFGLGIGGLALALNALLLDLASFWPILVASVPVSFACLCSSMVIADVVVSMHMEAISSELVGGMMGIQKLFHFAFMAFSPIIAVGIYVAAPAVAFVVMGTIAFAIALVVAAIARVNASALKAARSKPSSTTVDVADPEKSKPAGAAQEASGVAQVAPTQQNLGSDPAVTVSASGDAAAAETQRTAPEPEEDQQTGQAVRKQQDAPAGHASAPEGRVHVDQAAAQATARNVEDA